MRATLGGFLLLVALVLVSCHGFEGESEPVEPAGLRLIYLSNMRAQVTLWLDDVVVAESVSGVWIGERDTLTAGDHELRVTRAGDGQPEVVLEQRVQIPAWGEHTLAVTGSDGGYNALVVADSNRSELIQGSEAVIRLVNVHCCDTVVLGADYMNMTEYVGWAGAGSATAYGAVLVLPGPNSQYTGSAGLLHTMGHDISLPLEDLVRGTVYSFYAWGKDPDVDEADALHLALVADYPPSP